MSSYGITITSLTNIGANLDANTTFVAVDLPANTSNKVTMGNLTDYLFSSNFDASLGNVSLTSIDFADSTIQNTAWTGTISYSNVTGLGNIALLNLDGNAGNILYGNGAFGAAPGVTLAGDGGNISNIQGANVSGEVSFAATANSVAVGNVSGIGNVATANFDGNASNVLKGDGSFGAGGGGGGGGSNIANGTSNVSIPIADGNVIVGVNGTANVATFTPSDLVLGNGTGGNIFGANVITANTLVGNISGGNITGQVTYAAIANSVSVANVGGIGNIATANLDGNASNILYGNGVFAGLPTPGPGGSYIANGTSNVNIAASGGNVNVAVGGSNVLWVTSSSANVAGTANVGNLATDGNVIASGSVQGNAFFANTVSATGNITGNIVTGTAYIKSGSVIYSNSLGTNGQVLVSDGAGGTYWATTGSGGAPLNATAIVNGTSNVTIGSLNGNVSIGVGGTSNVVTIDSANVTIQSVKINGSSSTVTVGNAISQNYSDLSLTQLYISSDDGNKYGTYYSNSITLYDYSYTPGNTWTFQVGPSQMRQEIGDYSITYNPSPSQGVNLYDSNTSSYAQLTINNGLDVYDYSSSVDLGYTLGAAYWQMYTNFNPVFELTSNATSNTANMTVVGQVQADTLYAAQAFQLPVYVNNAARDATLVSPTTGMLIFVTGSGMQVRGATSWNVVSGTAT